jgi:hypothetical protein
MPNETPSALPAAAAHCCTAARSARRRWMALPGPAADAAAGAPTALLDPAAAATAGASVALLVAGLPAPPAAVAD